MNSLSITVSNVKCGGCVSNIVNGLNLVEGIDAIEVDEKTGNVQITGTNLDRDYITNKLSELGYPESSL